MISAVTMQMFMQFCMQFMQLGYRWSYARAPLYIRGAAYCIVQCSALHADVLHPYLFIEARYRQKHWFSGLMRDTRLKAAAEHKIPVIDLFEGLSLKD